MTQARLATIIALLFCTAFSAFAEGDDGETGGNEFLLVPEARAPSEGRTLSLNLDDIEIEYILKVFVRISGANLVFAPDIFDGAGRVTVNVNDKPWGSVLRGVLAGQGYLIVQDPGEPDLYTIFKAASVEASVRHATATAAVDATKAVLRSLDKGDLKAAKKLLLEYQENNAAILKAVGKEGQKPANQAVEATP